MAKVIWTDNAILDLDEIGSRIAEDSQKYAELTVERLFTSVDILEEFPRSGKKVAVFNADSIRELIRFDYRIVYKIVSDLQIDILTVHHSTRLVESMISESDLED